MWKLMLKTGSRLWTLVETAKLRSDAQAMIAEAPAYAVHSHINAVSRTLLGEGQYRNGITLHCTDDGGATFRVMLKPREIEPQVGERFEQNVVLHDWDVARGNWFVVNFDHFSARAITMRCTLAYLRRFA